MGLYRGGWYRGGGIKGVWCGVGEGVVCDIECGMVYKGSVILKFTEFGEKKILYFKKIIQIFHF